MSEKSVATRQSNGVSSRRWDPFEMLGQLRTDVDRLWRGWPFGEWPFEKIGAGGERWVPRLDAYEKDGRLIVKAELPGIARDDIEVSVENGNLIVKGERKKEETIEEENYYRMERSYGSFYRSIPLPHGVTEDQMSAMYSDGVLEVSMPLPVQEAPEPKRIPVK